MGIFLGSLRVNFGFIISCAYPDIKKAIVGSNLVDLCVKMQVACSIEHVLHLKSMLLVCMSDGLAGNCGRMSDEKRDAE